MSYRRFQKGRNKMKLVTGENCMPCKMLKQWLAERNIEVQEVYANENKELVDQFKIKSTPSLITEEGTVVQGLDNIQCYFGGEDD